MKRKLLLVVASIVLALSGAELALRLRQYFAYGVWHVPGWLRMSQPSAGTWHPFLRYVPTPSLSWIEVERGRKAEILINSLGFRSREISQDKPEGTLRIVGVGGSVVYDTRVSLADSWLVRLEDKLRARFPGRAIEVVNAGIPSRTSADSVVSTALRILPLDPDVLIVVHGVNDQKPNRYPGFKPDYSHWYQEPQHRPFRDMLHAWMDRSLLLSHIRYRVKFVINPNLRENWRGEALTRYDTVAAPGLDAYRRNLTSIIGMCRVRGVRVVIATVGHSLDGNADWDPSEGTPNPLVFYHEGLTLEGIRDGFRQYNRVNREVSAEFGCPLVDLEEMLPTGKKYYQDDVHFTKAGADAVADMFLERVPWQAWLNETAQ